MGVISSRKCQVFGVVFDSSVRGERSESGNLGLLSSVFVMLTALTLLQSFYISTPGIAHLRAAFLRVFAGIKTANRRAVDLRPRNMEGLG